MAEAEYNLEIIKAFPDSDIRKKKDLVLYHFVIENIAAEYLEEHQISLEAVIRESDYEWVLVIRGSGTPEQLKEDSIQLKACLEKALHMRVCIYGVPALVKSWEKAKKNPGADGTGSRSRRQWHAV